MSSPTLSHAQHLAQNGQFQDAINLVNDTLNREPNNTEALALLAMLNLKQNRLACAEMLIRKAVSLSPDNQDYRCKLALILTGLNKPREAIREYKFAISIDDRNPLAYYNLGILFRKTKSHKEAIESFSKSVQLNNSFAQAYNGLGNAYLDIHDTENALTSFMAAISLNPSIANAQAHAGFLLYKQGSVLKAEQHLRTAASIDPYFPNVLHLLGALLHEQSRIKEAIDILNQASEVEPQNADIFSRLGSAYRSQGLYKDAVRCYETAVNLQPDNPDVLFGLGLTMQAMKNQGTAVEYFKRVLKSDPCHIKALNGLGASFIMMGRSEDAIECCNRVLSIDKDNIDACSLLARIYAYTGDIEKSYEFIKPHMDTGVRETNLLLAFASICRKPDKQSEAITMLEELLASRSSFPSGLSRTIHFTLGRLYDSVGRFSKAFTHFSLANSLADEGFDVGLHLERIKSIISTHDEEFIRNRPRSRSRSERPVFIIGMPRSGTSLVEQILSSHPLIHGGGELLAIQGIVDNLQSSLDSEIPYPFCLEKLTQGTLDQLARNYLKRLSQLSENTLRVTDKLPGNFMYLGLIEQLFPNARVIHCIRDPLDTCLSCYFQDFTGSHPYSYDLFNLGYYYKSYEKLMEHWHKTLKLPILDVHYSELVTNFEPSCRRLVDFCDVHWNPACLAFHNSDRYVFTASSDQVKQPIYTRSVGRWKNYKHQLGPLPDILGININA